MIRIIIAQILYILRNNLDPEEFKRVLDAKNRAEAQDLAEAKGLCLEYVGYDDPENYIVKLKKGN